MADSEVSQLLITERKARIAQAQRAVELMRSAAERCAEPTEGTPEQAAEFRGCAVLALTAALELAAASGWLECLTTVELGG